MDLPLINLPPLSYPTGNTSVWTAEGTKPSQFLPKENEPKKKYKGLLQAPFGYFNLGIGLKAYVGGNLGRLNDAHPAYEEVKSDYETNPDKYWEGVVGIDTPRLFYEIDSPRDFSYFHAGLEGFLDFGQFRIGNEFLSTQNNFNIVMMRYVRDTWGADVTTAAEFRIKFKNRNLFLLGLNLVDLTNNLEELMIPVWLYYGLDRYEYKIQNLVYREVDNPDGQNFERLAYTENHGSGTGWNHRFFLELQTTHPIGFAYRLGFNVGELSSDSSEWNTLFYQFTAAICLGGQFDFLPYK